MKKIRYILLIFIITIGSPICAQETNIVADEVLVLIDKKIDVNLFVKQLNSANNGLKVEVKEPISKVLNIWLLKNENTIYSTEIFLEKTKRNSNTIIAQYNHTGIELRGDTCPNDTKFGDQWALKNTGQSGGTIGADIDACKAWGLTTADTTQFGDKIVVAVIDNGFDLNHNDLNFFTNVHEIPGNNVDDDGNGYVDDVQGWNTYFDTGLITSQSHGTRVAGIVSAKSNNGQGVSGVNWGMKVLAIQGSTNIESTVLKSYSYALDMRIIYDSTNGSRGAYVVVTNSSFGVSSTPTSYPLWCAFYDSLGQYGILSVGATVNNNTNIDVVGDVPTSCVSDYLITVNNTSRNDLKAPSGFGAIHIDMGAPGTAITSTFPSNYYNSSSGTSFAAPMVSGSVAFMYAAVCSTFISGYKANPSVYALKVKDAIINKGDSLSALLGLTLTGRRLNLYKSALFLRTENICSLSNVISIPRDIMEVNLFPNPNSGKFTLSLKNQPKGNYSYLIYTILGEIIESKKINLSSENQHIEIYLKSNTDKGLYFLCLISENGFKKNVKFVVK